MSNAAPVIAVIVAGAIGIVSVVGAGIYGWRDRRSAREVAEAGRTAALELAREERTQQRFADAYLEAAKLVLRIGIWAQLKQQNLGAADPPPEDPDRDDQLNASTLIAIFGSEKVRKLNLGWRTSVRALLKADGDVKWWEERTDTREEAPDRIRDLRTEMEDELRPPE